jgi:hypothetical protein
MAEIKMCTEQLKNSFEKTVNVRIQEDMKVHRNKTLQKRTRDVWERGIPDVSISVLGVWTNDINEHGVTELVRELMGNDNDRNLLAHARVMI